MVRRLIMGALVTAITLSGWVVSSVFANEDWQWPTVYTMSNETDGNAVLAFRQHGDTLVPAGSFSTGPIDMALNKNSRFLYVLNGGSRSIEVFQVDRGNGRLTTRTGISGLPNSANGLVAR